MSTARRFASVFVVVMWLYSWQLTVMVLAAIPVWAVIVIAATPVWRRRLDEKFDRGAENQSFLVESVTGIETLKAMAIEPQMQRRWEDKLAAYVGASFKVTKLAIIASNAIDLVGKILNEEPVNPSSIGKDCPPELAAIALKALQKEKRDRFATAKELALDLRAWLDGRPVKTALETRHQIAEIR